MKPSEQREEWFADSVTQATLRALKAKRNNTMELLLGACRSSSDERVREWMARCDELKDMETLMLEGPVE